MREINWKRMQTSEFLPQTNSLTCRFGIGSLSRYKFFIALFFGTFLLAVSTGCAPPSNGGGKQIDSTSNDSPEITDENLRREINDVYLREVPEESGTSEPISWRFDENEPKEFAIVEKQQTGDRATIILNIKTQSAPGARSPKYLAGQIRTEWKLQTGWALRTWEIIESENISMKYKNLPKPPATNLDR